MCWIVLNNRNVLPHSYRGWPSKIKVPARWISLWSLAMCSHTLTHRERKRIWALCCLRTLIRSDSSPALLNSFHLNYLLTGPSPKQSYWGLGFLHIEFSGNTIQSIALGFSNILKYEIYCFQNSKTKEAHLCVYNFYLYSIDICIYLYINMYCAMLSQSVVSDSLQLHGL